MRSKHSTDAPKRYVALDGLRTFAVLVVILRHRTPRFTPAGFIGVDAFFALSGYLITSLLVRKHRETGRIELRPFYVRRIARLTPALALVIPSAHILQVVITT